MCRRSLALTSRQKVLGDRVTLRAGIGHTERKRPPPCDFQGTRSEPSIRSALRRQLAAWQRSPRELSRPDPDDGIKACSNTGTCCGAGASWLRSTSRPGANLAFATLGTQQHLPVR